MSAIHIASAANEVAQALPSTATISVSKHGVQAIETLNLDAQTASNSQLTWSRTFSGMEILTNPTLHFMVSTDLNISKTYAEHKPLIDMMTDATQTLLESRMLAERQQFIKFRDMIRPTSDPMGNAAGSVSVTMNNASLSVQPSRDHRIVTTFFPEEQEVSHQRKHYGLNQLDQYAESDARVFYNDSVVDDVEKQHNTNALRDNYPCRVLCAVSGVTKSNADLADSITSAPLSAYKEVSATDWDHLVVQITNNTTSSYGPAVAPAAGDSNTAGRVIIYDNSGGIIGYVWLDVALAAGAVSSELIVVEEGKNFGQKKTPVQYDGDLTHIQYHSLLSAGQNGLINRKFLAPGEKWEGDRQGSPVNTKYTRVGWENMTLWKFVFDIYQPLAHPYFRDNAMRDNTLVNVRYFDCQITIENVKRLVEVGRLKFGNYKFGFVDNFETTLLLKNQSVGSTKGIQPQLILDLVTPSVPLPTISDKVISTYHTIQSTAQSMGTDSSGQRTKPIKALQSGNIQLAQVPDKIYVFVRSSKDLASYTKDALHVPTRLGVITNLRLRTPQNSAFLINMDQESLYQMSCRNGSKQSRSAFMSTLGTVIAIDPERDLGGYTNGVLIPFTFEVVADVSLPCRSDADETDSIMHLNDVKGAGHIASFDDTSDETFTMFVVAELQGHLYLMSDGTGKQSKSNLTVTEVADAVADGIHHPSTFGNLRTQKMDSGVLGEVGKAVTGEAQEVGAIMRA